jgi:hypothetical protein
VCKLQMMGNAAQHSKAIPQNPVGPQRANSQPESMLDSAIITIVTAGLAVLGGSAISADKYTVIVDVFREKASSGDCVAVG